SFPDRATMSRERNPRVCAGRRIGHAAHGRLGQGSRRHDHRGRGRPHGTHPFQIPITLLMPTSRGVRCACLPIIVLVGLIFSFTAQAAAPWWQAEWKHRYTVVAPPEAKQSLIVELE